jgi:hypothetical protein
VDDGKRGGNGLLTEVGYETKVLRSCKVGAMTREGGRRWTSKGKRGRRLEPINQQTTGSGPGQNHMHAETETKQPRAKEETTHMVQT